MNAIDNSLDTILVQLGELGPYQIYVFTLVSIAVTLHSSIHVAYVFTAMDSDYRCFVEGCDMQNYTDYNTPWLNYAIPYAEGKPKKCEQFVSTNETNHCWLTDFSRNYTTQCSDFVYKYEEFSIVQTYNLQCEDNLWKLAMVGTINNIGQFFGLFLAGILSDRFGRKQVLIWGMMVCAFFGVAKTFAPTYGWFLAAEFMDAAFGSGSYICGFIIGIELVGPQKRVLTGTIISSCYAIGEVLTAVAAWCLLSWRSLIYILYLPSLLLLSFCWLIPESVRWDLSKGRVEAAKKTIRKLAQVNGKVLEECALDKWDILASQSSNCLNDVENESLRQVFQSTHLTLRFLNCCMCWITCAFLFYGLTLHSVTLAGNAYLDFILTSLVEIPSYVLCAYIVNKYGRRSSLCGSFFLTAFACAMFLFVPAKFQVWSLILYLLGKFAATAAFTVTYVITSELFPTSLRNSVMGACSTFGRIGSMVSPQTPLLAQLWEPLPIVLFSSLSIIAGALCLFFPETVNIKLPDTIEEAVAIGKVNSVATSQKASIR